MGDRQGNCGDSVFVLDPGAAQDVGDLGDNGLLNDGEKIALSERVEDVSGET